MNVYTALSLSQTAKAAWTQHTVLEAAEAHFSRLPRELEPRKATDSQPEDHQGPRLSQSLDSYTAMSLTRELSSQMIMKQACDAEEAFVMLQAENESCPHPSEEEATEVQDLSDTLTTSVTVKTDKETISEEVESNEKRRYIAQSMVKELLSQQAYTHACTAEAKYVEVKVRIDHDELSSLEPEIEETVEQNNIDFIANNMVSTGTSTETLPLVTIGSNTEPRPLVAVGINTEPRPLREVGCNTIVNCLDVLRRAKEVEELNMLKADHLISVKQLNQEKSQRMVAEHLVKIVQSDVSELRQKNMNEVTTRMKLENELSDAKVLVCYNNTVLFIYILESLIFFYCSCN